MNLSALIEEIDEEGGADDRRDDSDGEFRRKEKASRQKVTKYKEDSSCKKRVEEKRSMIRSNEKADPMRNDQPYKSNNAGDGNGRCGENSRKSKKNFPHSFYGTA